MQIPGDFIWQVIPGLKTMANNEAGLRINFLIAQKYDPELFNFLYNKRPRERATLLRLLANKGLLCNDEVLPVLKNESVDNTEIHPVNADPQVSNTAYLAEEITTDEEAARQLNFNIEGLF